jgi:hypothetical protein
MTDTFFDDLAMSLVYKLFSNLSFSLPHPHLSRFGVSPAVPLQSQLTLAEVILPVLH